MQNTLKEINGHCLADIKNFLCSVANSLLAGKISESKAVILTDISNSLLKTFETCYIDERIRKLEAMLEKKKQGGYAETQNF